MSITISPVITHADIDSHADTFVLGKHALTLQDCNKRVGVEGHDPGHGDHTYRIMSGVVGFIHPSTGKQCMLEINLAGSACTQS